MKIRNRGSHTKRSTKASISSAVFAVSLLFLFVAAKTQAFTIVGSSQPLQQLLQPNATLLVDDKLFSNFFLVPVGAPNTPLDPTKIFITPIVDSFGPGILISGAFQAQAPNLLQFNLGYKVTVTDPNLFISDAHLFFNGTANGDGLATIAEDLFIGANAYQMNVFATSISSKLTDTVFIMPPVKTIDFVLKDIIVNGGSLPGSFASVSAITQTFSQIPEPGTVVLTSLGILALFLARRR